MVGRLRWGNLFAVNFSTFLLLESNLTPPLSFPMLGRIILQFFSALALHSAPTGKENGRERHGYGVVCWGASVVLE